MTKERNELQKKLKEWIHFGDSFYHISSLERSWQESRADCLQRHADLVIINSKEEQFDSNSKEDTKEYMSQCVDNFKSYTIPNYWSPSEPNGGSHRDEDCAEIKSYHLEKSWNDESCNIKKHWICEKTVL
ncbi:hypothetical protein L3Q82_019593 [Scortum barcoo]|uniref:Uncharacterized protein n=1 Tax=Scortum barcoo TaxID=214431 RepID=A0ACB8VCC8_9TELE|nr:hypothetical protein L3Q82_019593 [Scortum barcoo]